MSQRSLLRWRWAGPRLGLTPWERQAQFEELYGHALAAGGGRLRLTGALVGVELADGRRRRLTLQPTPGSAGLDPGSLGALLRDWRDERAGSWVAGVHGLQAVGQWLGLGPRPADNRLGLGWFPAAPPDATVELPPPPLLLRVADLSGVGRLELELVLQGRALLGGWSGELARAELQGWLDRLAEGLTLQRAEGTLAPPPPRVAHWPLAEEDGREATLTLLGGPDQARWAAVLQGPGAAEHVARAAAACLACGDELTARLAARFPAGPWSLPAGCGAALAAALSC